MHFYCIAVCNTLVYLSCLCSADAASVLPLQLLMLLLLLRLSIKTTLRCQVCEGSQRWCGIIPVSHMTSDCWPCLWVLPFRTSVNMFWFYMWMDNTLHKLNFKHTLAFAAFHQFPFLPIIQLQALIICFPHVEVHRCHSSVSTAALNVWFSAFLGFVSQMENLWVMDIWRCRSALLGKLWWTSFTLKLSIN